MIDLQDFRRNYQMGGLRRSDLRLNPIEQFEQWFNELLSYDSLDPNAMVLATVDENNQPRQRIVLLKGVDAKGFTFFTNRNSSKGQHLAAKPHVSLHFPWHFIERQVIVDGYVERLTRAEDADYFSRRPLQSQWGAWASEQSQSLSSRQELENRFIAVKAKYPNQVPLPEHWGGYKVVPERIEFWQGGENRLHDRFVYTKEGLEWAVQRLSP